MGMMSGGHGEFDPDILAPGLDTVFCGLNPGTSAVASGHSFSHPSNRFWQVVHLAGFTDRQLVPAEERLLLDYRCGITAVVTRATRGAAEVTDAEFRLARTEFEAKMRRFAPRILAFLGKRALAAMTGRATIEWGRQPAPFAGRTAWVLPNPSGLNRAFPVDAMVEAYAEVRRAVAGPGSDPGPERA